MNHVSELAAEGIQQAERGESITIRKLFAVLHGAYGNQFISKFATGEKDEEGRDKGIRVAMKVWEQKLSKYPGDVIETAAGRVQADHAEFPPNLPQFEKLCEAAMPRKTYAEIAGLPALPPPAPVAPMKVDYSKKNDGKDWARAIMARSEAGDKIRPYTLTSAKQALGMMGKMSWQ